MMAAAARLPVLAPMLATPGRLPVDESRWAFEVKWDGMRVLVYLPGDGACRLRSRNARDVTDRYPELAVLGQLLSGVDAILDAEIVVLDQDGRPSFARLQERMPLSDATAIRVAARTTPVVLMVFDVLWLAGEQVTHLAYTARRRLLEGMAIAEAGAEDAGGGRGLGRAGSTPDGPGSSAGRDRIAVPPAWLGEGAAAMTWTAGMGLEGVMAKRLASRYRPGVRSPDWIKIKHQLTADVTVGGWVSADAEGVWLKSLLIGVPEPAGLRYCGSVGTGFSQVERRRLAQVLHRLEIETAPFTDVRRAVARSEVVRWVRPVLTGEVEFRAWTAAGMVREPVWRGFTGDTDGSRI